MAIGASLTHFPVEFIPRKRSFAASQNIGKLGSDLPFAAVETSRAAERPLLHTYKPSFAHTANGRFPPFPTDTKQLAANLSLDSCYIN